MYGSEADGLTKESQKENVQSKPKDGDNQARN